MDRRKFLRAATGVGAGIFEVLRCPHLIADPFKFPEGVRIPTVDEYLAALEKATPPPVRPGVRGPENPFKGEVVRGAELLQDLPSNGTPYDVAFRFHQWRKGLVGSTDEQIDEFKHFSCEWPERGNPLIMGFFDATGLRTPVGDTTYWCSAFVSWCIRRSLPNQGSGLSDNDKEKIWRYREGAASASYRNWGETVTSPRVGDLAVFRLKDFRGHIGFVHRVEGDTILVLGGNQGAQNARNGGEVNIARFHKNGRGLKLHSFRTAPVLHRV